MHYYIRLRVAAPNVYVYNNNQNDMTPLSIHAFHSMNFFVLFLSIGRRKYPKNSFLWTDDLFMLSSVFHVFKAAMDCGNF
jgi:hypothetical protein